MARAYVVITSLRADNQMDDHVRYVLDKYGDSYANRLSDRFRDAVEELREMPTRHTRVRYLIGRRFEYRRVLIGRKHRIIYTIDESEAIVEVVRADLQNADPSSLDDLP